jgi:hypothetical protein
VINKIEPRVVGGPGHRRAIALVSMKHGRGTLPDGTPSGGNWGVNAVNLPGLRGGTFNSRKLGINNVRDVP